MDRERVRDVGEGALGLNLTVLALGGIREAAKLNFSVSLVDDKEGLGLGEEMVALRREGSALESLSAKAHAGKGEAGQEEEDDAVRAEDGVFCRGVEVRAERGCVSSRAWAGKRMRLFVSAGLYLFCPCIYARERESARAREREREIDRESVCIIMFPCTWSVSGHCSRLATAAGSFRRVSCACNGVLTCAHSGGMRSNLRTQPGDVE